MFGLARASQYAGWWSGSGAVTARTTVTTQTANTDIFMVQPRYLASAYALGNDQFMGINPANNTQLFDQTGAGTNERKWVKSTTVRLGTNWMTGVAGGSFTAGVQDMNLPEQVGSGNRPRSLSLGGTSDGNNYNFGFDSVSFSLSTAQLAALRNRWITVIVACSDNTSDFANWNASTDWTGLNWPGRVMIVDTETNQVLHTADNWCNASYALGIDLTQQYTVGYGGSNYFINSFFYGDNNWEQYSRRDIEFGSGWFAIGDMFDTGNSSLRAGLMGSALSPSIAGIRPWIWYMGTQGGVSTGYLESAIPAGSRAGDIRMAAGAGGAFNILT